MIISPMNILGYIRRFKDKIESNYFDYRSSATMSCDIAFRSERERHAALSSRDYLISRRELTIIILSAVVTPAYMLII